MGSALTVLLSITRDLSIILGTSLGITKLAKFQYSTILMTVFWIYVILRYILGADASIMNYFSTPLPSYIELIIPYVILLVTWLTVPESHKLVIFILFAYTLGVIFALFPSNEFDKMAANKFWAQFNSNKTTP